MSGQKIRQNDGVVAGGLLLDRVAIGEFSEERVFDPSPDWQEGANLVNLRRKSFLGREQQVSKL